MKLTIRDLYPYTLIEGQGMGTAYEYFSKLRVLRQVFAHTTSPKRILAAGLPETHGFDLDFVLLAQQLDCELVVGEDRPSVLAAFNAALDQLEEPSLTARVKAVQLSSLLEWNALGQERFDWVLSTAAVQRLPDSDIVRYVQLASRYADYGLLFVPNRGNRAHLTLTGLRGLDRDQLTHLCLEDGHSGSRILRAGYCDIAPFPPGLQRSEQAKENALSSPLERIAMVGLEWWCRGEHVLPSLLQRRLAHLVYVGIDLTKARS